ncbi:MAG: aspartate kinase [Flavobacteriaceae bacterium]|nr:aspartate kinase [Flavobacteriaceae bacterium]
MLVLKFGGTSVGSVENMTNVKNIIKSGGKKVVVLSAMSGTTNILVALSENIRNGEVAEGNKTLDALYIKYNETINELLNQSDLKQEVGNYIDGVFDFLRSCLKETYSELLYNNIVSQGEFLSTFIFSRFLIQEGMNACLLPALDFMRIDRNKEPDNFYIRQNLNRIIDGIPPADIYITQGFICLDADGEMSNLERGGSDYTATIIGSVINAEEVQIWTDIDGFHNNDPRFVENTHAISDLSYDEAAELAYFGAKILHPQTVMPVRKFDIPVRLKNTMSPESYGTLITSKIHGEGIKAIAAKDAITAIKIKSARMLNAHGFLKKVFEIFEKYETPIDMITTSEIAISLTIDDDSHLESIVEELKKFALVEVDNNQSIVCLVGHSIIFHEDTHKLFQVLQDVNVRMISYGGSNNNISLLVHSDDKLETLRKVHNYVFN